MKMKELKQKKNENVELKKVKKYDILFQHFSSYIIFNYYFQAAAAAAAENGSKQEEAVEE